MALPSALLMLLATPQMAVSAERLVLRYGPLRLPMSLTDLEAFQRSGALTPTFGPYVAALDPQFQQQLRQQLDLRLGVAAGQLAQFLHSPMGELFLSAPQSLLVTQDPDPTSMLRQALIQAAHSEEGLTLVNLLRHLPEETEIDLQQMTRLWREYLRWQEATQATMGHLEQQQAAALAARTPHTQPSVESLQDLRQPGPWAVELQTLELWDGKRDRNLTTDLYLPTPPPDSSHAFPVSLPLVVLSHGLGANRQGHAFFAQHLASHGIAAAVLQHPGSDSQRMKAMLQGKAQDSFEVSAFVERPRDVSFVLDELQRRNATEFGDRLQLDRVAVYGHSLGAYTALVLAGASLDFEQLQQDCQSKNFLFNPSLLLQCRAKDLPPGSYEFRDSRVAAILLIDPVSSSILGPKGLGQVNIPVFWSGSDADLLTPLMSEQLPAFQQLASSDKYLSVIAAIQHVNLQLDRLAMTEDFTDPQLIAPKPKVFQDYVNALGLAFVQRHLAQCSDYQPYLSIPYAQSLDQTPHALRFLPPGTSAFRTPTP